MGEFRKLGCVPNQRYLGWGLSVWWEGEKQAQQEGGVGTGEAGHSVMSHSRAAPQVRVVYMAAQPQP